MRGKGEGKGERGGEGREGKGEGGKGYMKARAKSIIRDTVPLTLS